MRSIEKIQIPIKEELTKFERIFKTSIKSKVFLLNIITKYLLRSKGEQIRPMFVFLSAKLNGNVTEASYTAASLIELLHTATIIHDDVVNESYEKKGIFSIHSLWRSKIAVLMGDYLLSKGLLLSVEKKAYDLLEIISEAIKEMSEGELIRIQRSRNINITKEQYFEIIGKKTATLISTCLASGAKSVGSDSETLKKMTLLGEYIGIAFQIKNELLDFPPLGFLGELTSENIQERKLSLPMVYSFENSSKDEIKELLNVVNSTVKHADKHKTIIEFVTHKGGLKYASSVMYDFRDKALEILSSYPNSDTKSSFIELVNFTIDRNK